VLKKYKDLLMILCVISVNLLFEVVLIVIVGNAQCCCVRGWRQRLDNKPKKGTTILFLLNSSKLL